MIIVEVLFGLGAVLRVPGRAPELAILEAADAASIEAMPPERCAMCTVSSGWRSNTPELISRMVAMISENSRPTPRAVS